MSIFSFPRGFEQPLDYKIVASPLLNYPRTSYGILMRAADTGRWLLVKRRFSSDFCDLMRGIYRPSALPDMISHMSWEERKKLNLIINDRTTYNSQCLTQADDYIWYRLQRDKQRITAYLAACYRWWSDTEWLWPKGRLKYSNEGHIECAQREFEEESGTSLSEALRLSNTPITDEYRGSDGYIYKTVTYLYQVPREMPLKTISEKDNISYELCCRRWVSTEEALRLLPPSKSKLLAVITNPNNTFPL